MHGNASYRGEGAQYAEKMLSNGLSLFVFDFIGCGMSDGDYISLGHYEQDDLEALVEYLRKSGMVSKIILYGRSMGAATSLLYVGKHSDVAAAVADSSFARFPELFKDIAAQFGVPEFFVKGFYDFVRQTVRDKNGFDVESLSPIAGAAASKVPAMFVHATNDTLIPVKHSKEIYDIYGGKKELVNFIGHPANNAHNGPRPKEVSEKIMQFILANSK